MREGGGGGFCALFLLLLVRGGGWGAMTFCASRYIIMRLSGRKCFESHTGEHTESTTPVTRNRA